MKMTINQYRIMIEVFRSFGIITTGKKKHHNFFRDFLVNLPYVMALLFEMELRLGIYLEEEAIIQCCCPMSMVVAFNQDRELYRNAI